MDFVLPVCRDSLQSEDFEFIVSVLSRTQASREALSRIVSDAEIRDKVLDSEQLFHEILNRPDLLRISPFLFFYVVVRRELLWTGLDDREVADYVGNLLTKFADQRRVTRPLPWETVESFYLVDLMQLLEESSAEERFYIQAHMGNFSLFITGLFPETLRKRKEYRGAPDISYYESVGSNSFQAASSLQLADEYAVDTIFSKISVCFRHIRHALNHMSEKLLNLGAPGTS